MFHWMTQDAQTETEEWIEMLRYTLMRLGIFVGCFVVVWALVYSGVAPRGLGSSNGMWMILLALVVSAPISFIALRKERDRASAQIAPHLDERINRVKSNLAANRSVEDEADDEARKQSETASGQAQAS
ncbi:membrane protein [Streptomyces capitiformicae]|uniref:Membrane protein n=2 Tax=Streptomyces capitiformicae TaxID=2014920 RepID=A0A919L8Y6_9ACTN|nr:membrane protein [Streptomyces capitiformicae]